MKKFPPIQEQLRTIHRIMNTNNLYYKYSTGIYRGYSMRYVYDEDPAWLYERLTKNEMSEDERKCYRSF